MSAVTATRSARVPRSPEELAQRRARLLGGIFLTVGLIILWFYGVGVEQGLTSEFVLNPRNATTEIPNLKVPTRETGIFLGLLCGVLGGIQIARGFGRATAVVGAIVGVSLVFAFLSYTARGDDFSFVGMLAETITRATPLTLGALAGILCERSGIINIAIEGMMLGAAFAGAVIGSVAGSPWFGIPAAMAAGMLLAALLAVFSIKFRVDQIIGGTAINILVGGLTAFTSVQLSDIDRELIASGTIGRIDIPLLQDIPLLGPVLFRQGIFTYAMYVLVAAFSYGLFKTRWGLRLRAAGEHPKAADTVGINVLRTRYRSVILAGAVAGLAGAYFTLGSSGVFEEGMTNGRGFIALAAVIFGRWRPFGALSAALLFGFAEALQPKLAILGSPLPSQFLQMAPYVVTIIAVAGLVGASRAPAAEGKPYP